MFTNQKNTNFIAIFSLLSIIISVLSIVVQLLNFSAIRNIAENPATVAVLGTGETRPVTALKRGERTPESIRLFTSAVLYRLFNWTDAKQTQTIFNPGQSQSDEGVITVDGRDTKIPAQVWESSFAISSSFRIEFLENLTEIMPDKVLNGSMRSLLILNEVSDPQEIEKDKWQVIVRGNINFLVGKSLIKSIPVDRVIYLKAIDIPALPDTEDELSKAVYNMRFAGLEIYSIEEISAE